MTSNPKTTVLVAGPDPLLRMKVREQIEADGFDVVEAESDAEAWEMHQAGGIDRCFPSAEGQHVCTRQKKIAR